MSPSAGVLATPVEAPLRWWDLDDVLTVEAPSFGADAWSREGFLSELAEPSTTYMSLRDPDTGQLQGYVGVAVHGSDADLQTLAVAPQERGRGIGALLLRRARQVAASNGARRLHLEVREDNEPAVGLYRVAGFTREGRRPSYYAGAQPGASRVAALLLRVDLAEVAP